MLSLICLNASGIFIVVFVEIYFLNVLVNDRVLPELNNQKFVDFRIKIKDAILTPKQFLSTDVMKYFKTISNGKYLHIFIRY